MNDELTNDVACDESPGGVSITHPGSLLRQARQTKHLEPCDIANQLHLSTTVIEALETDDYERLPPLTFVRGYLRAYARLVDIDGDHIVAVFEQLGLTEKPPVRVTSDTLYPQATRSVSQDRSSRWFICILILGLLSLGVMWWHSHRAQQHPGVTLAADASVIPVKNSFSIASKKTNDSGIVR